jgi:hypothetical protein
MYETISIDCESVKKRVNCANKVAFELFIEVIFIPRYSKKHCSELWWNSSELHSSTLHPEQRPRASTPDDIIKEMKGYKGKIIVGRDLDLY